MLVEDEDGGHVSAAMDGVVRIGCQRKDSTKISSLKKNEGRKKSNKGKMLEGKLGGRYFGAEVCQSMHQASDGRSEGGILRLHDEMRFDWSRANENKRKRNRRGEEKT